MHHVAHDTKQEFKCQVCLPTDVPFNPLFPKTLQPEESGALGGHQPTLHGTGHAASDAKGAWRGAIPGVLDAAWRTLGSPSSARRASRNYRESHTNTSLFDAGHNLADRSVHADAYGHGAVGVPSRLSNLMPISGFVPLPGDFQSQGHSTLGLGLLGASQRVSLEAAPVRMDSDAALSYSNGGTDGEGTQTHATVSQSQQQALPNIIAESGEGSSPERRMTGTQHAQQGMAGPAAAALLAAAGGSMASGTTASPIASRHASMTMALEGRTHSLSVAQRQMSQSMAGRIASNLSLRNRWASACCCLAV